MFQRRLQQAQQLAGAAASLGGSTVKYFKSAIFSGIASQSLPGVLFRPLAVSAVASSAVGLAAAKDKKDFVIKLLGLISSGGMFAAVYYLEGPVQIFMFTAALGGRAAGSVIEAAYKYGKNGELKAIDKADLVASLGEAALIIPNLYIGGVGKVMELAKVGEVTPIHQSLAWGASYCSSVGSAISLFKTAQVVDVLAADCKDSAKEGRLAAMAQSSGWNGDTVRKTDVSANLGSGKERLLDHTDPDVDALESSRSNRR